MKRIQLMFVVASIGLLLTAFTTHAKDNWSEKRVVVAGRVLNFESQQEHKTIQFLFNDLLERRTQLTAVIKADGTFQADFPLLYPQDFYIDYGTLATLFCAPGDSLFLEVDAAIWQNRNSKKINDKYFVQVSGGTAVKTNQDLHKFLLELPNEKYTYGNANDAVKSKSPEVFTAFIQQREKEYRDFLKKFNKENKTNKTFRAWADNKLKYESWADLMRYRWEHPHYNKIHRDSLRLPQNYFAFLSRYNMNDNGLISMEHANFLHEFFMYAMSKPAPAAPGKRTEPTSKDDVFGNIKQNTSGFTQQVFLASLYHSLLQSHALEIYEKTFEASVIPNPYLQKRLQTEYEKQKVYLANQNTLGANLASIENSVTAGLIQTMASKYKDKVIYIDFWAPWCGPCMEEMPNSKIVQEYFKDKEVVFLFLANRTKDDSWKATIANKGLTGEHINLTEDQFNVLASEFNISGIPHYTLIDKKGNIILKNAPRPGDAENLKKEIEKLLE